RVLFRSDLLVADEALVGIAGQRFLLLGLAEDAPAEVVGKALLPAGRVDDDAQGADALHAAAVEQVAAALLIDRHAADELADVLLLLEVAGVLHRQVDVEPQGRALLAPAEGLGVEVGLAGDVAGELGGLGDAEIE